MIGNFRQRLTSSVERIGADEADTDDLRLQKRLLVAIALMIIPAAILWGGIYLSFYRQRTDRVEEVGKFAAMTASLKLGRHGPLVGTEQDVRDFAKEVGYPLLSGH